VPAEAERGRGNARYAVLSACPRRKGRVLGEERELREGDRDHREVDPDPSQCEETDDEADKNGEESADDQCQPDTAHNPRSQEIGRDEAARSEEGGLTEGEQPGKAEQQIEAEADQSPDQDPAEQIVAGADHGRDGGQNNQRRGKRDFRQDCPHAR
jgi:hypothetical protein